MHNYSGFESMIGFGAPVWLPLAGVGLFALLIWGIFWKGLALWHSAQRGQPWWFIVMLFLNTAGILEIVYLFAVAKVRLNTLFSNHHHTH